MTPQERSEALAQRLLSEKSRIRRRWEAAARAAPQRNGHLHLAKYVPAFIEAVAGALAARRGGESVPATVPGLDAPRDLAAALREHGLLREAILRTWFEAEPRLDPEDILTVSRVLDAQAAGLAAAADTRAASPGVDPASSGLDPALLTSPLLAQMPVGITIARAPDAAIILHNREAERLIGGPVTHDEGCESYAHYGAIHADGSPYAPDEYPAVRAIRRGELIQDEEMRYIRGDGRETWLLLNAAPISDAEGSVIASVTAFYDIADRKEGETERRVAQEALEDVLVELRAAIASRDMLLAVVSHDLRNPLAAIHLATSALRSHDLTKVAPRAERRLDAIERSSRRMDRLISDLLDVVRIESGTLELNRTLHPIDTVLAEIVELEEPLAADKGVVMTKDLDLGGVRVLCDCERLGQALGNVLANAVKFCGAGDHVTVRSRRHGDTVEIAIEDTGPGIPEPELAHVFDPYWSAGRGTKKGTGLGLHITRAIVEGHGGRVRLDSAEGQGTTVTISLPVAAEPAP